MMAAAWSAAQFGAVMLPGGLQPMTSMLEQHLLQMAAARDPSWIAMCDGFKHDTRDDCLWHRLAGRPTWSAGLARSRGRQLDGDGQVEVNLMAAALFLVSESVLAAVRSDFAEVAVINGTAQQTDAWTPVTTAASSCSVVEADGSGIGGCAAELLDGVAWPIGGS